MLKRRMENVERGQVDATAQVKSNNISPKIILKSNESYETDADGTKVIVRKFDIPLPSRNFVQPTILRSPLSFCAPKEKWKYQHDVPDGKIVTKRVHVEPNPTNASNSGMKPESTSASNPQPSKLYLKSNHTDTMKHLTRNSGFLFVAPSEQTPKVYAPVSKTINTEKITVNNLPENVIPNSIKVVDKKIVNGRKVIYLKAFKEVGKVVSKSVPEAASFQCSVEQNKSDNKIINSFSPSGIVANPLESVNACESNTKPAVTTSLQNNLEPKKHDTFLHNSANVSSSAVIPLLNVSSGEPKTVLAVAKPSRSNVELRKVDSILGKPVSVLCSNVIPQLNMLSCDGKGVPTAIAVQCNTEREKKDDSQVNAGPVVASRVIPFSNVKYFTRTVPAYSVLSQNNREAKQNDSPVIRSVNTMNSGKSIFTKVTQNIIKSSGREITLQLGDTTNKLHGTGLHSDTSSQNTTENNSGTCHEVTSGISDDIMMPLKNVRHVDKQKCEDDQLKLVPADSTTPFVTNPVESTKPVNFIESNIIASEVLKDRESNKTSMEEMVDVKKKSSNISCAETIISKNNKPSNANEKIIIVNQMPSTTDSSTVVIPPKQNVKYDDIMRRRKIALQYQRDVHKNREMPKMEKVVELPARKVKLIDTSTQTALFCMLEPGKMVEMLVTDDSNEEIAVGPSKSKNTETKTLQTNNQSTLETTGHMNSNISFNSLKHTANSRTMKELMDIPLPKRMRLDQSYSTSEAMSENCQDTLNENSVLSLSMDISDFEQSQFQALEKENLLQMNNMKTSTELSKGNENDIRNVNILAPLACIQSAMNSNANINEINAMNCSWLDNEPKILNKDMKLRLFKDYSESLVADDDGNLPIHNAVMDKDLKQVQRQCLVLAAQKRNIDVRNRMKETPLHLAVLCHDLRIVTLLLKFKAKTDIPDGEGNTALHMAIKWSNDTNILETLLKSVEDNSPALNVPNDEGYSLMHLCALHNKGFEALLLVEKKADINIRDRKSGRTPLFHAVESGNTEMSRMLVNSGASTTISNFSGQTPLNASEVTFALDMINENLNTSKQIVAPCSCRSEGAGNEHTVSHSEICADVQRRVSIEDVCTTDVVMCDEPELSFSLLNFEQAFNDR